ncbi:hypothetical protein B0H19DRAFT_1185510 [Mycena capillaripes]|nr:hypothetical protein B0H19DRAFT_1185510 [Mycena capillaripes]
MQGRVWNPQSPTMSTSNSAARNSRSNAPFALQRRRTLVACTNCRKRKMRCITTEQPPKNPCARCTKKGLPCEYVSVEDDDATFDTYSPPTPPATLPQSGGHSRHQSMQAPAWASQPMPPSNNSVGGIAPPLPYTGPPPPFQRPRYSGGSQYPDLSLQSQQQNNLPQHYPAQPNQSMANPGYNLQAAQPYQYMNRAPTPAYPGAQQPGGGGYPAGYGQTQYYGETTLPDYGWPPQQSSSSRYPGNDPRYG